MPQPPTATELNPAYLPIVYLRGYAATQGEINSTVDDPFYGFNLGSTHVRVDADGKPVQFFFESPLVRLMSDYGYRDVYQGEYQSLPANVPDPKKTIWIFRYYDATADTYTHRPERWSIEESARELRKLIAEVRRQTGASRVHLVAHSMGGLVARSLLQKIYPEAGENARHHVARLFTFGTPHGGIQLRTGLGWVERVRDALGALNADDFGPDRMYAYLTPGAGPDAKAPDDFIQNAVDPKSFDPDHIFCAIGTNAKDYDVAFGGARFAVGPQSDGLVQIGAAYVRNAHRAYVHRSHSGRYGIVNSEEAFQNLERFLFGDIQARIGLQGFKRLPPPEEESIQVDVRVSVRGLPVHMNEQTRDHYCPVILNDRDNEPVPRYPIFTQFLNSSFSRERPSRFALSIAIKRLRLRRGQIDYREDLHNVPTWADTLVADVVLDDDPNIDLRWSLAEGEGPLNSVPLLAIDNGRRRAIVPLPAGARAMLGADATLVIDSCQWRLQPA